jgi:hypothetical protein
MLTAMNAYPESNDQPQQTFKHIHAVIEAKSFIIKAYEKRVRKLDRYLKNGIINEDQYKQLRNEFAGNADVLLRAEIKDQNDYSYIRLMAVFDVAEAIEFKLD